MAKFLILALALTSSCCLADQPRTYNNPEPSYGPANYQFAWNVLDDYSKNNFGQNEKSDAGLTSGSYYVALPDGRLQKVTYTVNGDEGYRADVTYEGEARVVSYQPQAAASSYKPVQVPAPRSYTPVVATEAPYQQSAPVVISNPAPATYRDSEPAQSAPVETFEPVAQSAPVESSNAPAGEVYYKPVENAPEPEIYYKPVAEASTPEVYYKPLPADYKPTQ